MPVVSEGELEFAFPDAIAADKFDGPTHGLSHCMKAVDFVVECSDRYLFVEVKDPSASSATPERQAAFAVKLMSDELSKALTGKLRDSLIYRWAEGKLDKPVYYLVLIELPPAHGPSAYLTLSQKLRDMLPVEKIPVSWKTPIVAGAAVLNMKAWNALRKYGSVRRK